GGPSHDVAHPEPVFGLLDTGVEEGRLSGVLGREPDKERHRGKAGAQGQDEPLPPHGDFRRARRPAPVYPAGRGGGRGGVLPRAGPPWLKRNGPGRNVLSAFGAKQEQSPFWAAKKEQSRDGPASPKRKQDGSPTARHSRGAAGLTGAWKAFAPFTFSFRLY